MLYLFDFFISLMQLLQDQNLSLRPEFISRSLLIFVQWYYVFITDKPRPEGLVTQLHGIQLHILLLDNSLVGQC